ncbi:MAG: hypothetical protein NC251_11685 [Lachnoclostridium sp.]|nr:hypothetical protein [Lachnospira sp.]MCM1249078.1 hypothetical protein [Lachnoclostridium sp.]MCM1536589.1 hypothetical protein [Clostridium sp.]
MEEREERTAEGFVFYTKKDAELATQEQKKIEYLQARMNYSNPESILRIYEKALEEKLFKTPVGLGFLKDTQKFLVRSGTITQEEIPPISLHVFFDDEIREQANPARRRVQPAGQAEGKKFPALPVSIILNIVLVLAVIAMFWIALGAGQPNILNYENVLVNKYAQWEQELTQREQTVREKELELSIGNP